MLKKMVAFLLILILVISMSACAGKEEENTSTETSTDTEATDTEATDTDTSVGTEPVEIFLAMCYPEGHAQYPVLRKIIDQFKEENPNVTVNEELIPSQQHQEKMLINYASGSVPNIFTVWPAADNKKYIESGEWLNLDPYLEEDATWANGFNDGVLDSFKFDGIEGAYGLPFGMYYLGFYYNKELFDKASVTPPSTWDEFLSVIDTLNASEITPLAFGAVDAWRSSHLFNTLLLKEVGIDGGKKIASRELSYDSEGVINAFEKMQELVNRKAFADSYFGTGYAEEVSDFFAETVAMRFSGTWTVGELTSADAPVGFSDKVGYFAVPYFSENPEYKDIWNGGVNDSIAVSADATPEQIAASVKLAKMITSSASAKAFLEETGLIPAVNPGEVDGAKTGALLLEVQRVISTSKGADSGVGGHEPISSVTTLLGTLPQTVIGKGATPEEAAKELQKEVDNN